MEKIEEILLRLEKIEPMLKEFVGWKEKETMREQLEQQVREESEREFAKWLEEKKRAEAATQQDEEELKGHFFGCAQWKKERFAPRNY
jgi:Ni,Fe-hydrogenase III component G